MNDLFATRRSRSRRTPRAFRSVHAICSRTDPKARLSVSIIHRLDRTASAWASMPQKSARMRCADSCACLPCQLERVREPAHLVRRLAPDDLFPPVSLEVTAMHENPQGAAAPLLRCEGARAPQTYNSS
eukprot:6214719-Pleurochrysis_carterae.AAC.1